MAHLQVVVEEPQPVPAVAPRWAPLLATTAALAVVLALLAGQRWQLPARAAGVVSDVPKSLVCFLLVCAGACLWAAGKATRPAETFRSPTSAQLWWVLTAGAALVSIAPDPSLAAPAGVRRPRPGAGRRRRGAAAAHRVAGPVAGAVRARAARRGAGAARRPRG